MKPTRFKLAKGEPEDNGLRLDRLTQLLIWTAIFLTACLAALVADVALAPTADGGVAQAVESNPTATLTLVSDTVPTASAQPLATDTPTKVIEATLSPATETALPPPVTPPPCVPPDDWGIHTVQEGNSLESLAQRYGTDVETLMRVNCLNTHTVFINQRLYVPGQLVSSAGPSAVPGWTPPAPGTPGPGAVITPMDERSLVPTSLPSPSGQTALKINIPSHYLNIVLLGSDKRPNSGAWRTDSMIVVSVDLENNIVRLLSIPRDLWVYIPGHGYNRINTADLWGELARKGGGPDRVKQTIYYNLGIPVHYYVRVDFQGFMEIIDTVGGVDVDVDCPLPDINLSAGMQHMDGKQALRYARSRKSTNDFDRGRRQRKVLMALWEQGLSLDLIPKLPSLWRTMAGSFQTDLPLDQVINLAYVGTQLKPQRILTRAIGSKQVQGWITPQGAAVLLPRQDRIKEQLDNFYAPRDLEDLDKTEKVRLQILNGTQRSQVAQLAAAALRWEGYQVARTGGADRRDYARSQILVYNGDMESGMDIAKRLSVPDSAVQDLTGTEQPDPANPADIIVILGNDYDPCQR